MLHLDTVKRTLMRGFLPVLAPVLAGVVGVIVSPGVAAAQRTAGEAGPGTGESPLRWEVDLGYGYGIDISSQATFLGDVRFAGGRLRLGRAIAGPYGEGSRGEGDVVLFVELPGWVSLEPARGYAVGATLLARYALSNPERMRPFAEVGAGPIHLDFNNDRSQADGLSFTLQGGLGVSYPLTSRWALAVRAHFHHISNAGLRRPNPGINDLLFTFGVGHGLE